MNIDANNMHFQQLNEAVRSTTDRMVVIDHCNGQRYIASGLSDRSITINGTPGNALGAYLDGCHITVNANAQDATGDTMNEGVIEIHGSSGDATGYAMRGGRILVEGNVGYRAGIHMKQYEDKIPVLVVGGTAGSFLGEYQAGGIIIVLGLDVDKSEPVIGHFCGTGMHGGRIYLRVEQLPQDLPEQVIAEKANEQDMETISSYLTEFCAAFDKNEKKIRNHTFYILRPNTKNPYKQLYTPN